jgi:ABC-2 type transport system ATP-binding protein
MSAKLEIDHLFKEFDVENIKFIKAKKLSHGQSNTILIMQSFLNNPKLVLLDEPFNGLDIKKIILLRNFLKKKSQETTIILSSHGIDEIDRIATHIGILHNGKLILQGKKEKIKKGKSLEKFVLDNI